MRPRLSQRLWEAPPIVDMRWHDYGLAQGDFELALRGLLGDGAPLSPSSIARLRGQWEADCQTWQERRLDDRELVHAWADGSTSKPDLRRIRRACWS